MAWLEMIEHEIIHIANHIGIKNLSITYTSSYTLREARQYSLRISYTKLYSNLHFKMLDMKLIIVYWGTIQLSYISDAVYVINVHILLLIR